MTRISDKGLLEQDHFSQLLKCNSN